jgi:hypothetical protein
MIAVRVGYLVREREDDGGGGMQHAASQIRPLLASRRHVELKTTTGGAVCENGSARGDIRIASVAC